MKLNVGYRVIGGFSVLVSLSGCGSGGGGGDGSGGGQVSNPLWVHVDSQNSPSAVSTGHVDLSGEAYCDSCPPSEAALGQCPEIRPFQSSDVRVTWKNQTTGATGDAIHGITGSCSCLFSYCVTSYSHKWSAYGVPLAVGDNVVEISALASGFSFVTPVTITRTPAMPEGVIAAAGKEGITLQWDSVAEAASYNVYWSTSPNANRTTATRIAGATSPFSHTGLTGDNTYYYFVTAVNWAYESPVSQTVFATPGWQAEVLAATATTSVQRDTSIAVDSAGHPHVHYSFDETVGTSSFTHNYYLTKVGGAWTSAPLGNPSGVDANIAVASDDTVLLSYIDFHGATHAAYSAGAWTSELIDARGWCDSSLAVDSAKMPHAVYYASSSSAGELRYASEGSGLWVPEVVGTFTEDVGCSGELGTLSLAVEAAGTPHIAYSGKYPEYGLKYSTNEGGAWVTETVDTGYVANVSIVTDNSGKAYIAYTDNAGNLKNAKRDASGNWAKETVASGGAPSHPSITLDAAGHVHISYVSFNQLKYTTNSTGSWKTIILDREASSDTALALDSLGKAHISYFGGGNLKYISNR